MERQWWEWLQPTVGYTDRRNVAAPNLQPTQFGLSPAYQYGRPVTWGVPNAVRSPLQRLVYMLPRWYIAAREVALDRNRYTAVSTGDVQIRLPAIPPTGTGKKKLKKWQKAHYFDLGTAITVPGSGVNSPLVSGSRGDPRGVHRPVF